MTVTPTAPSETAARSSGRGGGFVRPSGPNDALAQTGEYSIFGLTRAADHALVRERQVGFTLLLFGIATIVAVLYSVEKFLYDRLSGVPVAFTELVPAELLFTYTWALLAPIVMSIARRYPVWGRQRASNWAVQVAAMVGFVLVHVALLSVITAALDRNAAEMPRLFGEGLLSWTVLDSIVFCTLVAIHQAVVYYRVSKDRALRASQLEARLAQAQIQMLRMQLQPHFLFNTLHSISALMHKDVQRADSMVVALSDLLRLSLKNIGAQEVRLQAELDFLERYVEIMTLRFGDRLQVVVDVDPEARDARVPNLFLQPLVENAFRHGFGDVGQGAIRISVQRDGDLLRCDVADNGRGLSATHKEGVGLSSTRQRLAHLYGDQHEFSLRGAPGEGVRVTMAIPFQPFDEPVPTHG